MDKNQFLSQLCKALEAIIIELKMHKMIWSFFAAHIFLIFSSYLILKKEVYLSFFGSFYVTSFKSFVSICYINFQLCTIKLWIHDNNLHFSYLQEHIQEVLDKWTQIDDEIWAKIIVFERNRRVAKAYARVPVLTVNGSEDGFDGMK